MSEEADKKNSPVMFDDLVRFFTATCQDTKCFVCGSVSWTILTEDDEKTASEASLKKSGSSGQYLPVYIAICRQCGFVRSHHSFFVHKWLRDNPVKPEEVGSLDD